MRVPHFSDCRFQSTVFKQTHQIKTTEIVQEKGLLTEKDKTTKGYIIYITRRRSHTYNRCSKEGKPIEEKDKVVGEGSALHV